MAGGNKEVKLNLRLTAKDDASKVLSEFVKSLSTSVKAIQSEMSKAFSGKEMTAGITEATRVFDQDLKNIGSSAVNAGKEVNTAAKDMARSIEQIRADNAERAMKQLQNTTHMTKQELVTDVKDMEAAWRAEGVSISNVATLNVSQLSKIRESVTGMKTSVVQSMDQLKNKHKETSTAAYMGFMQVQQTASSMGRTIGGAFVYAIKQFAAFDDSMAHINAVVNKGGKDTTGVMKEFSSTALRMGLDSKFSANEIAMGMYDLARQGLSASQILSGGANSAISVVNDLAQATDSSMTDTATVVTDVMHEYNLSGSKLRDVANIMSGALHNSSIDLNQFYQSMKQVGPVASSMHQSVNDVSTALAIMAQHGVTGSAAGTAVKNMLLGLEPRTKKAANLMKELGISTKDGAANSFYQLNGNLKPMPQILQVLNDKFGGLSDHAKQAALAATFTKYGLAGLNTVVTVGKDKFEGFKKALLMDNAAGQAKAKMDSLSGDMHKAQAAVQTLAKGFGETLRPELRFVAQTVQKVADWFSHLSEGQKKTVMVVAGVAASLLILGAALTGITMAFINAAPAFAVFGRALGLLGPKIEGGGRAAGWLVAGLKKVGPAALGMAKNVGSALLSVGRSFIVFMATNPMGWIIGVVALVAFGVYEIIKHWDSVKKFLGKVFSGIATVAHTVWNGITGFFKKWGLTILAVITGPIGILVLLIAKHWNQIKKTASDVWNGIVNGIKTIWNGFVKWISGVVTGFVNGIVNAFKWMYNHNYYFKMLVDGIVAVWNFLVKLTNTIWNGIKTFLVDLWRGVVLIATTVWNGLKKVVTSVWDGIKTVTNTVWNAIKGFLMPIWNTFKSVVSTVWNAIHGFVETAWNKIRAVTNYVWNYLKYYLSGIWDGIWGTIKKVWDGITGTISNVWHNITGSVKTGIGNVRKVITGLWGEATKWGENLITMIANGIKNAAHKVADAAKGVAKNITKFLGFHSPTEEGPASDSDQWAPNFVNMFTGGLKDGTKAVSDAATGLAQPLQDTFGGDDGQLSIQTVEEGNSKMASLEKQKGVLNKAMSTIFTARQAWMDDKKANNYEGMAKAHEGADGARNMIAQVGLDPKMFGNLSNDRLRFNQQQAMQQIAQSTRKTMMDMQTIKSQSAASDVDTMDNSTTNNYGTAFGSPATSGSTYNVTINVNGQGKDGKQIGEDIANQFRTQINMAH